MAETTSAPAPVQSVTASSPKKTKKQQKANQHTLLRIQNILI